MTPFTYMLCGEDDALWDDYFLLLMGRYAELKLPYEFRVAFSFIGDPIIQGDALLVRDADGRTAGVLGFIFLDGEDGTPAAVCQAEALYLREEVRGSAAFFRLLQAFSAYLAEQAPGAGTIRFWSPADRADLRRLFGKFCRLVKTNDKSYGRIDLFETSPARLEQYTSRRATTS
ncbi:hypothetical protein [Paenibacillus sp.]|uniref:hypothetical protein n=1 Tax=Paenibacillus sp. TaxID=58172 RepID=UPI002D2B75A1|nr:hypothetical protein [Paenibacillus sp.]HZG85590.1 hypothetical protein [Paenibacillus sp.]